MDPITLTVLAAAGYAVGKACSRLFSDRKDRDDKDYRNQTSWDNASKFLFTQGISIHTSDDPLPHLTGSMGGKTAHIGYYGQTTLGMFNRDLPGHKLTDICKLHDNFPQVFENSGLDWANPLFKENKRTYSFDPSSLSFNNKKKSFVNLPFENEQLSSFGSNTSTIRNNLLPSSLKSTHHTSLFTTVEDDKNLPSYHAFLNLESLKSNLFGTEKKTSFDTSKFAVEDDKDSPSYHAFLNLGNLKSNLFGTEKKTSFDTSKLAAKDDKDSPPYHVFLNLENLKPDVFEKIPNYVKNPKREYESIKSSALNLGDPYQEHWLGKPLESSSYLEIRDPIQEHWRGGTASQHNYLDLSKCSSSECYSGTSVLKPTCDRAYEGQRELVDWGKSLPMYGHASPGSNRYVYCGSDPGLPMY
jgi:hypothetical protein